MDRKAESGNVLVYILIAVVLFAALGFAVSNMMRGGSEGISREKASLYASEVMAYAKSIEDAVNILRISNNCIDTQISFETPLLEWMYENPDAPSDKSCHVFDKDGGGAVYKDKPQDWVINGAGFTGMWFNGETAVLDIGTTAPELILWITELKPDICDKINKTLNGANATEDEVSDHAGGFEGAYVLAANGIGNASGNAYRNNKAGCLIDPSPSGLYNYYHVLITR